MNILNKVRKLIKDTSDSSFSREDKLSYIEDSLDFYNRNILKYKEVEIKPETDGVTFLLPSDYSTLVDLYIYEDFDEFQTFRDREYKLFELEDYIIDEINGIITILRDIQYTSLKLQYNRKATWTITTVNGAVTGGSNAIITLTEIDGFKTGDEIIIDTVIGEEQVKIKSVDKNNKQIVVDLANDINDGSTVIGDLQILKGDMDIVSYYTANLTYNISNGVTSGGTSTKWTQGKISYEERKSTSTTGGNVNGYMDVVGNLLKNHPSYIKEENSITFGQITLT